MPECRRNPGRPLRCLQRMGIPVAGCERFDFPDCRCRPVAGLELLTPLRGLVGVAHPLRFLQSMGISSS